MIKMLLVLVFVTGMLLIYTIGVLVTSLTNSKMTSYYEQELKNELLKEAYLPILQVFALIKIINYEPKNEKFDEEVTN